MKIMIFGRPGSGKSTFANQLSQKLDLLVYHLDKYFYIENWVEREQQDFLDIQKKLVNQASWIIDGNNTKSLEMRYSHANIVIYFELSRFICLWRIIKRYLSKDQSIDDRATGCCERLLNWKFLVYTWTFDQRVKAQIELLKIKYPDVKFYKIQSDEELLKLKKQLYDLN